MGVVLDDFKEKDCDCARSSVMGGDEMPLCQRSQAQRSQTTNGVGLIGSVSSGGTK